MGYGEKDMSESKEPRKPRKPRQKKPNEKAQEDYPKRLREAEEEPDLSFELEKLGLGESQVAQQLKSSIDFVDTYKKEHKKHLELLSSLAFHKFISLKKAGFTSDQAFAFLINKSIFEF